MKAFLMALAITLGFSVSAQAQKFPVPHTVAEGLSFLRTLALKRDVMVAWSDVYYGDSLQVVFSSKYAGPTKLVVCPIDAVRPADCQLLYQGTPVVVQLYEHVIWVDRSKIQVIGIFNKDFPHAYFMQVPTTGSAPLDTKFTSL